MEIKTQKDLENLIKMLRKQGVDIIKVDGIEMHLGKMPLKASNRSKAMSYIAPEESIKIPQYNGPQAQEEPKDDIDTDDLSEEDLLFYSATGEAQ